ncbi:MAG TPA: glycosyl transferase family protein [Bryobacteraceae bacterium]
MPGVCSIDRLIAACLPALAVWILLSGLDDLFLDLACFGAWVRRRWRQEAALPAPADGTPEKPIAIFLPLWHEHRVIGHMLAHNLAAIRYTNFSVFVGGYPNDEPTLKAVREAEARFANVHLALCPHGGPTSKADCLNWIYQRMLLHEQDRGVRFEVVVIHDAEDLIHPEELRWISRYTDRYEMVQIPVLPLPTPARRLTHGVYCDEFAEYQTRDMPARGLLGGFIPSNGVGTGYTRRALELLAQAHENRIFDPLSLTEDYENGIRLHRLGCAQLFLPIRIESGQPVATREFFPQRFGAALKQRTRWVTGNSLQAWERHGWSGGPRQVYWLWRDRKGLVGNPISAVSNVILAYGIATWLWSQWHGTVWGLAGLTRYTHTLLLFWATFLLQAHRTAVRCACTGRIYGVWFAALAPVRTIWSNWINSFATLGAVCRYTAARLRRRPLVWLKTEHMYPSQAALRTHKRRLGEILLERNFIGGEQLARALESKPAELRMGEHLVAAGCLNETELYQALSIQQSVPFQPLESAEVPKWVARALPGPVSRKWSVLPFRVADGCMYVVGPDLPSDAMQRELRSFTRLEIRFQYVTPSNFRALQRDLLGKRGQPA